MNHLTKPTYWTPELIAQRFEEAVDTGTKLVGAHPCGYKTFWPDVIHESKFHMGNYGQKHETDGRKRPDNTPAETRLCATGDAIDRFDEVQSWLTYLTRVEVKIVWLKAVGKKWAWIGRELKPINGGKDMDRNKVRRLHQAALVRLANRLNNGE